MAGPMTPNEFVAHLHEARASAILRTQYDDAAAPAMEAAIRGGFRIVEFTLTIPNALSHIESFGARDDIIVGAGTVLSPEDVQNAVTAGARFLVSPIVDEAVIEEANRLGVAVMPGAHTPTEMVRAHRAGAPLVKLFPAASGGPSYVQACLGPLPFLRIVPTGGVNAENAGRYLEAGAHAVGFVAPLFDDSDLREGRFDRTEARARVLLSVVGRADVA